MGSLQTVDGEGVDVETVAVILAGQRLKNLPEQARCPESSLTNEEMESAP